MRRPLHFGNNHTRLVACVLITLTVCCSAVPVWMAADDVFFGAQVTSISPDSFKVRALPINCEPNPIPECITTEQLRVIMLSMRPYFQREKTFGVVPVGPLIHSMRLWGTTARFPTLQQRTASGFRSLDPLNGDDMLDALLDDAAFARTARMNTESLLTKSEHGIQVATSHTPAFRSNELVTHFGQVCKALADAAVPSSTSVMAADGFQGTVADIVRDDAARVATEMELEWITAGLARYADCSSWTNRFGEHQSFDMLTEKLLAIKPGDGTCNGTHIPYALTIVLRVHREHSAILSPENATKVADRLREYSDALEITQTSAGFWPWDWAAPMEGSIAVPKPELYQNEVISRMITTGHHLEWIALAPEDCRPNLAVTQNAARFLIENWNAISVAFTADWHYYSGATHAARSLWLLHGAIDVNTFTNDQVK